MYGEACVAANPSTFIQTAVQLSSELTERLAGINSRLNDTLLRIRGNVPEPQLNGEQKQPSPNGQAEELKYYFDKQASLAISIQNKIEELSKYF